MRYKLNDLWIYDAEDEEAATMQHIYDVCGAVTLKEMDYKEEEE